MDVDTYVVNVSPRALADLASIFEFVEKDSPSNAIKLEADLWAAMQRLSILPHRYRVIEVRRTSRRGVRRMPVGMYLTYYRVLKVERIVRIITVRHAARRQPRSFE